MALHGAVKRGRITPVRVDDMRRADRALHGWAATNPGTRGKRELRRVGQVAPAAGSVQPVGVAMPMRRYLSADTISCVYA